MHKILGLVLCILLFSTVSAQISPPGLGDANTASWLAIGLRQRLDSANHKQYVAYAGMGRISNPDDYNPIEKTSIFVLNQEFYNQFHKHWQYSVALSYRRQNEYESTTPYEKEKVPLKQEFRIYSRYSFIWKTSRLKWVTTYRQEFRKFYTNDFKDWEETYQLRSRTRTQLTVTLDKYKVHNIVASAEALFSLSKEESQWGSFAYRESRFCLYYSYAPVTSPLVFSLGYMNNLIGSSSLIDAHYIALDIIWTDPFGNLRKKKIEVQDLTN
ncbi:MAG: hypothetical protein JWM14_2693 [Chitinophagaceae bacterium]|nr:hypothetical protein [Chitinophagaceae bacterium]